MLFGFNRRRATESFLVALIAVALPSAAEAATINILLGNQDVSYLGSAAGNTGAVFDTVGGHSGGTQTPGNADEITTATFELDNVLQGTLIDNDPPDLYGDFRVNGVGNQVPRNVIQTNVGNNGNNFGYDFFTSTGYLVELNIDKLTHMLIGDGIFFFHGTATVNLATQNLPFNLAFTSPTVNFSYSSSSVSLPPGAMINMAMASGQFSITGEGVKVPEPAVSALFGSGLAVAGVTLYRRRQRNRYGSASFALR